MSEPWKRIRRSTVSQSGHTVYEVHYAMVEASPGYALYMAIASSPIEWRDGKYYQTMWDDDGAPREYVNGRCPCTSRLNFTWEISEASE